MVIKREVFGVQLDGNMTFTYQPTVLLLKQKEHECNEGDVVVHSYISSHFEKSVLCLCSVNLRIWSDTNTTNV